VAFSLDGTPDGLVEQVDQVVEDQEVEVHQAGGTGNTPPTSPPQGNAGGDSANPTNFTGGGGGATHSRC
jgi:hypothetical protein